MAFGTFFQKWTITQPAVAMDTLAVVVWKTRQLMSITNNFWMILLNYVI
jgi:hypothetical protein